MDLMVAIALVLSMGTLATNVASLLQTQTQTVITTHRHLLLHRTDVRAYPCAEVKRRFVTSNVMVEFRTKGEWKELCRAPKELNFKFDRYFRITTRVQLLGIAMRTTNTIWVET